MPQRTKRLRNKGGRRFKQTPDDRALFKWLGYIRKIERLQCDGCGRFAWLSRAHLQKRSQGGRDLYNIAMLCENEPDIQGCHPRQERFMGMSCAEMDDLRAKAVEWTERFYREREAA